LETWGKSVLVSSLQGTVNKSVVTVKILEFPLVLSSNSSRW